MNASRSGIVVLFLLSFIGSLATTRSSMVSAAPLLETDAQWDLTVHTRAVATNCNSCTSPLCNEYASGWRFSDSSHTVPAGGGWRIGINVWYRNPLNPSGDFWHDGAVMEGDGSMYQGNFVEMTDNGSSVNITCSSVSYFNDYEVSWTAPLTVDLEGTIYELGTNVTDVSYFAFVDEESLTSSMAFRKTSFGECSTVSLCGCIFCDRYIGSGTPGGTFTATPVLK